METVKSRKKREKDYRRTVIKNGAIALVALTTIMFSCYAWMLSNRENYGSGIHMQLSDRKTLIENVKPQVYKVGGNGGVSNINADSDLINTDMAEFDTVFTDRNANTPLIVRVEFGGIPTDYPELYFSFDCDGELAGRDGKMLNNLSNIINIRYGFVPEVDDFFVADDLDKNADKIYFGAREALEDHGDVFKFVRTLESTGEVSGKDDMFSIYFKNYDENVHDNRLVLYLEICYDTDLIDEFLKQHEGDSDLDELISFDCDLGAMAFEYVVEETGE